MGVGDEESGLKVKSLLSSEVKRRAVDVINNPLSEIKRIIERWEHAKKVAHSYYPNPDLETKFRLDGGVTTLLQLRQVQQIVLPSTSNILKIQCERPILPADDNRDPQTFVLEFIPDVAGTVKILVGQRYENQKPLVGVGALISGTEDFLGRREVTVEEGLLKEVDRGVPFSRLIDIAVERQALSLTNAILANNKGALVIQ